MNSLTEENYLKALLVLSKEKGEVTVNKVSNELGTKMPTVNSMIKKLAEKELVHYESYKPIKLTESGRKQAALILRKHRLTEKFLYEKMGFSWEQVHAIAEQIEHIQSDIFFDKMDELLGHPKFDPHGEPIPSKNGDIISPNYIQLNECSINQHVKFVAVSDSSDTFLQFLNNKHLSLETKLTIKNIEPYDGSITLLYEDNTTETFSRLACSRILVIKE